MTADANLIAMAMFKPVPGGFVYRAPNAWLIGRGKFYFVTEAQRAEIVARSSPPKVAWLSALMIMMVLLGLGAAFAINWYRHDNRFVDLTPGDIATIIVTTLLAMLIAIRIAVQPLMNRLQPLLATLPKSDVRISSQEIRRAALDLNTAKQLRRQAAVMAFIAAGSLLQVYFQFKPGRGPLSGNVVASIFSLNAIFLIGFAIHLLRQAKRKAKLESETARK